MEVEVSKRTPFFWQYFTGFLMVFDVFLLWFCWVFGSFIGDLIALCFLGGFVAFGEKKHLDTAPGKKKRLPNIHHSLHQNEQYMGNSSFPANLI